MADEREKILKILLEYVTDKQSVGVAKSALKDIEKSIDGTKSKVKELTKALDDDIAKGATKAGSKLQELDRIGMGLEKTGRAFGLAWVEGLGGAVGSATDLIETLSQIKSFAGLGGAGGLAGGLSLKSLGAAALSGGGLLAGAAGVGLGAAGYEGARAAGLAQPGSASLGQFASVGAYGAGSIFGEDTAQKWFKTVAEALGELPPQAEKATKAIGEFGSGLQAMPAIASQAVQQAQQAIASGSPSALGVVHQTAAVGGGAVSLPTGGMKLSSTSGVKKYAAKIAQQKKAEQADAEDAEAEQEERKYQMTRNQIIRSANAESLKAEQDFQRERKQAIKSFNLDTKHLQEDHQMTMTKMEQAGKKRLDQLANERDAIGFFQEQDRLKTEKSNAESEYQQEMRQRQEKFDEQLRQEKQDFEAMQSQRKLQAQEELKRLKDAHDAENSVREEGFGKALDSTKKFANNMKSIFDGLASQSGKVPKSTSSSTMAKNSLNQAA